MARIPKVTDEKWKLVYEENKEIVEDFLEQSTQLSDHTIKQYASALRIFFYWVYEYLKNKPFYEIKPRDYLKYQNWLISQELSSSGIRMKKSAIASLNKYIEVFYIDEHPTFRDFTSNVKAPKQVFVHKKEPLSLEEYEHLCEELEKQEEWQKLAYLKFSFASAGRRSEVVQLKKEVVNYKPKIKELEFINENGEKETAISKFYVTHDIRCKGHSKEGNVRPLAFDEDAMIAFKKWIEVREKDDCEYMFISGSGETAKQLSPETLNLWCRTTFEEIVGRRVHPHLIRETRATSLVVEQGRNINVAKKLLGHKNSATTEIYVIREDEDDADEAFI